MERFVRANAFDRDNLRAVGLGGKEQTGAHRPAVEHNRASAAYAVLAADMGSDQTEIMTQKVHQRAARFDGRRAAHSIDRNGNRNLLILVRRKIALG